MRKLALATMLTLAALVPAVAFADDLADPVLTPGGIANPLTVHEARLKLRLARERAQPPKPTLPDVAIPPQLESIAQCESGGDPTAIGGGGLYRGKYQFSVATWQAVGGSGDPATATEAEQDRRAALLYARSGPGQWPVCGS